MKKLFVLVIAVAVCHSAAAALYFQERFSYASGNLGTVGSAGGWVNSNSGVTLSSNSLDGAALGLAASTGNKVTTTSASASGTYNQFSSGIPTGNVYFSFLLRVNSASGLSSSGQVLTGLIRAGSQSSYYIDMLLRVSSGNVQIGVTKLRAVTNWHATPLVIGSTYLVVGRYQFVANSNNDGVALWVNPAAVGNDEPAPDVSFSNGSDGNDSTGIGRCFIYGGAAVDLDEVRIGSTWAEVTPPAGSVPPPTAPYVTQTLLTNEGLVLRGTNGSANAPFQVLTSTNVTAPQDQWIVTATNTFAANGNFDITNPVSPADTQRFYRLRLTGASPAVPPAIISQPQSQTVAAGEDVTFDVAATGTVPLSYQWYFNTNTPLAGRTSSSLTLTNVGPNNAGGYSAVVANSAGAVTSAVATLTVTVVPAAPAITTQPQSQTVNVGQTAVFSVVANGTPPLSYQWYFNTNTPLANATNATLTLSNVQSNDAGGYSVLVTNSYGAATSLVAALTVNPPTTNAPDFGLYGFATVGFNLTGGAGGPVVTVTTGSQLNQYTDSNSNYVIYVSGTLQISGMDTHVRSHKTIFGLGTDATLVGGGLYMYNSSNIIVRNLTIRNSSDDNMGITSGAKHIWIDHCTFVDARDGGMDIVKGADYVTVSWCKFYYTGNLGHNFVNLVGASDGDNDMGRLRVTFHHNWWSSFCVERMPSVRYGRVHIFNNYYNAPGNNYCVRSRLYAECRIENNYFENVRNPWEVYITSGTTGKVYADGNVLVNTTSVPAPPAIIIPPGTDIVFTPPYSYALDPASEVPEMVMTHAGAGRGPFAP